MNHNNQNDIYNGVRRNAKCPCGSGERFKNCHGDSSLHQTNNSSHKEIDALFCSVDGSSYDLPDKQCIFVAKHSDMKIQLYQSTYYVLRELATFNTYENHYENCSKKFVINKASFNDIINTLQNHNLLITPESAFNASSNSSTKANKSEIAGIMIRTCESPLYLKRILDSQIRRKQTYNTNEKIYIFDDSSSESACKKNQQIVKEASDKIDVYYHGKVWQSTFIDNLTTAFPNDSKVIRAMLSQQDNIAFSGGRILNLAILFFAGKKFLSFDDDFQLDDARLHPENSNDAMNIHSEIDWVFEGYENKEKVKSAGAPLNFDPISQHKEVLGLSFSELKNKSLLYKTSKKGLENTLNRKLENFNNDSFVITSGSGWFGTPGKRNGRFLFTNKYKATTPPWKKEKSYEYLLEGGYCWDAISNLHIMSNSVSNPAGINNQQFLPPTLPTCQGEDTLLSLMILVLYPNSFHLGFPWALSHFRAPKTWKEATFNTSQPIQLYALITDITFNLIFPSNINIDTKVKIISTELIRISELSLDSFKSKLISVWLKNSTSIISKLNEQLNQLDNEDESCKKDIQEIIDNDSAHLFSKALPYIEDAIGTTETQQLSWLKRELSSYANGLRVWPKLWQHCL